MPGRRSCHSREDIGVQRIEVTGKLAVSEQEGGYCADSVTIDLEGIAEIVGRLFGIEAGSCGSITGASGELELGRVRLTIERLPAEGESA